jgi:hypothetical protein
MNKQTKEIKKEDEIKYLKNMHTKGELARMYLELQEERGRMAELLFKFGVKNW